MLALLSLACTDYNLYSDKEQDPIDQHPDILVEPEAVDVGIVCDTQETSLWIYNHGNIDLTVEALEIQALEILGGDWELVNAPTPFTIAPAGYREIHLKAGAGEAVLNIQSDDPEDTITSIPLLAAVDQPPSLEIITPYEGQVLTGTHVFEAYVADDVDDPEWLMSQWHSSVDGMFSSDYPKPDGTLEAVWTQSHASGVHSIRVMVLDSCGNSSEEIFWVCQQMEESSTEIDISTWAFEGTARWDEANDWIELTNLGTYEAGSAFAVSEAVSGAQVDIEFSFYMSDGTGADGISLTALDVNRMTSFFGNSGGGIGYEGLPGWSIEVDNYYNEQDPTDADHLTFTFDGQVHSPEIWVPLPDMEDGRWHQMRVTIREPHVYVEIDGIAYINQEISGFYDFDAYVGFTAATGSQTNRHLIDSLVVSELVCGD